MQLQDLPPIGLVSPVGGVGFRLFVLALPLSNERLRSSSTLVLAIASSIAIAPNRRLDRFE
ncbi:hypothetical protein [Tolypothrix sp. VBCCA 56010]|uniref:hypothetical protein n=1 Tax=Tolypothrix sp. VBCCA 56010 TaxID=3137731 RepID=UPI003D7DF471